MTIHKDLCPPHGHCVPAYTGCSTVLPLVMLCPKPLSHKMVAQKPFRADPASWSLSKELRPEVSKLVVQKRGSETIESASGVHTGPKGMPYDVGDDTGDADVGHPGYHVLWKGKELNHTQSRDSLGWDHQDSCFPGGPVALPELGRRPPGTFLQQAAPPACLWNIHCK